MTETEFERCFQKAIALRFIKTIDYTIEPPVVDVVFPNGTDGIDAYRFLQDELTKDDIKIVFRPIENEKMNLSIMDSKNLKVFNIYGLKFSKDELFDFRKNSDFGKYFVFAISKKVNQSFVFSSVVRERPLMVSELVFSE